ncbi:winged helix-turn-helix transcriptional regulator [Pectobacterium brasiliense]|uniref:winged helix-turn-helix transcriptional regulator n=1 Tax=Pectobacterium brasiliense TaxID=180957 RepID=UPI001968FACB|nr:helix-turn-helix domain-containing protein [Pectobacterium brasiliense]MBN3264144.1 helix-turn-helix transcriptional regulator [Pectobacterium brasiliense]
MKNKDFSTGSCPIARSLVFLGDAWTVLILRDAHAGMTRFDQFRKSLGIVPTMLTKRLTSLTQENLLQKRLYSEHPPREEYVLTESGRDFLPVLFMYEAWGRKYRGEGELMRILDDETGLEVQPVAIDRITGAEIGTRPFHIVQPKDSENITQDGGSNDIVRN